MTRLYLHNLGCAKNQIEGELLAGWSELSGIQLLDQAQDADIVVVNTCAFIQEAQEEAIEAILEATQWKTAQAGRRLYVCGCLPQRFSAELQAEIPEVDGFFGVESWMALLRLIAPESNAPDANPFLQRQLGTPAHYAYLRIADGCDRGCSYCVIPSIRGRYRSRAPDEIVAEARALARRGVKELIPIAQELNSYGHDLRLGRGNEPLIELLQQLSAINGIEWVRPLYLHPPACDVKLWEQWATETQLCHYLDLPIEHASDRVLKAMGRGGSAEFYRRLIMAARNVMPDITVRTAIIVGFPGETEADFREMLNFVEEMRFERLGSFRYSAEVGTPAAQLPEQIPEEIKAERQERLMTLQAEIADQNNLKRLGGIEEVFVERYEPESGYSVCRSRREAPEQDGEILVWEELAAGLKLHVKIVEVMEHDLIAEVVD